MARRDPLDTSLIRLCSLAEKTTVLLREVVRIRDAFHAFRFDPDALAGELTTLAQRGRAAHSDRLDGKRVADVASEEARELAQAAYDALPDLRARLDTAARLASDPIAAEDLRVVRRRLTLKSPRATGALDLYRRVRDHLERPDHPVYAHALTATIHDEVVDRVTQLDAALVARDAAVRQRRIAVAAAEAVWTDLRDQLRLVRQMGEIAATRSHGLDRLFGYLATRPAPTPSRGPGAPSDPGATPSDPGATPSDPGATPSDPGACPSDPGATPSDPGATPSDPGAPSNRHFDPSSCEP